MKNSDFLREISHIYFVFNCFAHDILILPFIDKGLNFIAFDGMVGNDIGVIIDRTPFV